MDEQGHAADEPHESGHLVHWLMAAVLVLPFAAYKLYDLPPEPGWRASYFGNAELKGAAKRSWHRRLDFKWEKEAPLKGVPADGFSARFETCLTLPNDAPNTRFMLVSDDGARLLVDGERVVDRWKGRGLRSGGAKISLPAGPHHLRVDYRDVGGHASVALWASFDGAPPQPLPLRWLSRTGRDRKAPCRR